MGLFKGISGGNTNITPQEARRMMDESDQIIILDVRTPEEYKEIRIEGAKLIPVDELGGRAAAELPDKDIRILVYCRSGGRAGTAVKMLKRMGYAHVYNFGGIMNWPYAVLKG